jgi:hypothetical protein
VADLQTLARISRPAHRGGQARQGLGRQPRQPNAPITNCSWSMSAPVIGSDSGESR